MRILLLTTHLEMGGIAKYVTTLAKVLKHWGHTVFVASSGGEMEEVLDRERIRHIHLDIRTKSELSPKVIKSFFRLKAFLKDEKINLIHAHTRVTQVLSELIRRRCEIPYVTTCHGFFKRRIGRRMFGCWGEKVIAISEAVREGLIRDFNVKKEKIEVIHTGIELEKFLNGLSERERTEVRYTWNLGKRPVVGTIGRLSSVKGQDILLKAAALFAKDLYKLTVLLVGDGPEKERLKKFAVRGGFQKGVFVRSATFSEEHPIAAYFLKHSEKYPEITNSDEE